MGVSSSLILRKPEVPRLAEIVAAAAGKSADLGFPDGIELDDHNGLWMPVLLDGKETGFDFAVAETADETELPKAVRKAGRRILYFEARGAESARAVDLVRDAIASLTPASTWFEAMGVLVGPDGREREVEDAGDRPIAAPPEAKPPHPALRVLLWLLDHWLLTGLVGGAIAIGIGALVGER